MEDLWTYRLPVPAHVTDSDLLRHPNLVAWDDLIDESTIDQGDGSSADSWAADLDTRQHGLRRRWHGSFVTRRSLMRERQVLRSAPWPPWSDRRVARRLRLLWVGRASGRRPRSNQLFLLKPSAGTGRFRAAFPNCLQLALDRSRFGSSPGQRRLPFGRRRSDVAGSPRVLAAGGHRRLRLGMGWSHCAT